jgi:hypothetical protein
MHPGWSQFCKAKSLLAHAQGIAAEILFCRRAAKKIGAESPFFGAEAPKMRPNSESWIDEARKEKFSI